MTSKPTHTQALQERWRAALMPNYGVPQLALSHGVGAQVWDVDGREYIDMLAGIAVNIVGHAHPRLVRAVSEQMSKLGHTSNFAAHEPGVRLAERILESTGRSGKVFFCNSGTEANEAAIKLSRLTGRSGLVGLHGSFHGRTMGSLSLTGQPKKQDPFRPLLPDVEFVTGGDIAQARQAITNATAAFWYEPISGEGGVLPLDADYIQAVARHCRENGTLVVADEVQTGIARTGVMYAHQWQGVQPDVLLLAKGLGGGFPIGACVAFGEYGDLMTAGSHGTTYGGNAVACAAALEVLDIIHDEDLLNRAKAIGTRIVSVLEQVDAVDHVRGEGAMQGVVLKADIASAVEVRGRELGVILNAPLPHVLRLVPPLVITDAQLDSALDRIASAITDAS